MTRNPLRILVLNWRDPKHPQAGGAEKYLFELAKGWVADGNSVVWLSPRFKGSSSGDFLAGVTIHRMGNAATFYALAPLFYLRRLRNHIDVIVDSENGIPSYSPLFSRVPVLCVMYHVHKRVFEEQLPTVVAKLFVFLELKVMPAVYRGAQFVTISNTTREEMMHYGITSRHIPLVHGGVDGSLEPRLKATLPTILYLGRLKKYKRIEVLIQAMPTIIENLPMARLIIAGDGDQGPALSRTAKGLGVAGSVDFLGFVDEMTKARLLGEAWVFASASSMEGWGLSVIEAGVAGTPAVVSNSPGLSEAVEHNESGIVCETQFIALRLLDILTDSDLRRRLSFGAERRAREFSWKRASAEMLDLLHREVERKDSTRRRG